MSLSSGVAISGNVGQGDVASLFRERGIRERGGFGDIGEWIFFSVPKRKGLHVERLQELAVELSEEVEACEMEGVFG